MAAPKTAASKPTKKPPSKLATSLKNLILGSSATGSAKKGAAPAKKTEGAKETAKKSAPTVAARGAKGAKSGPATAVAGAGSAVAAKKGAPVAPTAAPKGAAPKGAAAKATSAPVTKAGPNTKSAPAAKGGAKAGRGSRAGSRASADSDSVCREVACEGLSTTGGYCRMHYIKNWKKIKRKELILKEKKLNQYIEELVAKYPDKYIEAIRQDLANDKDFAKVIYDLDLDESVDDFDVEGESVDSLIDHIKRDFEDEGEGF